MIGRKARFRESGEAQWIRRQAQLDGVAAHFGDPSTLNPLKYWVAGWTTRCANRSGFSETDFSAGSGGRAVADWHAPDDYWRWSLEEVFPSLRRFDFCVLCGATAWILMRVFEAFGFDAWTLDLGSPPDSRITHVVTLVRTERGLEVFDSDTGLTLSFGGNSSQEIALSMEREISQPADFGEKNYLVEKAIMINVDRYEDLPDPHWLLPESAVRSEENFKRIRKGIGVYTGVRISPDILLAHPRWAGAGEWLHSLGVPAHPLSLFLFPQGISSLEHGWVDRHTRLQSESTDLFARLVKSANCAKARLTS